MVINKYLAELIGTFILVFVGSLSILASGGDPLVIALGFGLGLLAAVYAVGDVSGSHFNPAVTLAMWLDKRTDTTDLVGYWIGQLVGATLASVALLIASDQNTVAATYRTYTGASSGDGSALLAEIALTAIFVLVVMVATVRHPGGATMAMSLTLAGAYLAAQPMSGASLNPARTLGPSIIGATGESLWVYVVGPLVGAGLAWVLYRLFHTEEAAAA
jgi:aquaporin Z